MVDSAGSATIPTAPDSDVAGEAPGAPQGVDFGYQVALDSFSGPLDLLLFLVRRSEVDIADIQVTVITDQYIAAVTSWQELDLDTAGDFILMAATLLELKSRLVAPPELQGEAGAGEPAEEEELFDPRASLIKQLLAYRRFKEATQAIGRLEAAQAQRLGRQLHEIIPEDPEEAEGFDLENCDSGQLFAEWERMLSKINGLGPRTVINDDVPLEVKINILIDAMRASREARLSWLFEKEGTRIGKVVTLMATLECARQRFIEALQHEQYGEVFLRYREDQDHDRSNLPQTQPAEPTGGDPAEAEPRKRRRRLPLVTWTPTDATATEPVQTELELEGIDAVEEVVESDEQRFVRELEEACAVEAVLGRTVDIEASFAAFRAQRQAAEQPGGEAPGKLPGEGAEASTSAPEPEQAPER
jgi:segregation and condensation protein A